MKETFLKTVMEGAGIGRKKAEYLWQIGVRLPAEQHQGEPVAIKCWSYKMGGEQRFFPRDPRTEKWGVDMSEYITDVEPLYTHADPGEVERLRNCLRTGVEAGDSWKKEAEELRAQLDEAHVLLLSVVEACEYGQHLDTIKEIALSASAEPSATNCLDGGMCEGSAHKCDSCDPIAPVERDERAAFAESCDGKEQEAFEIWAKGKNYDMTCHPLHWLFLDAKTYAARQGWAAGLEYATGVARAALERKP